jgi:ABC-type Mn2+/Zn2+ transport system permease subunit
MDMFSQTFIRLALAAGVISSGICAYLGVFVILKRIVFVGIALAELGALGVILGFTLHLPPLLCASVLTFTGVLIFWAPYHLGSLSRESLIGLSYCLAAGLSVILLAKNPAVETHGLDLISGNLLYARFSDLPILLVLILLVGGTHLVLFKELLFVSYDRETAESLKLPAKYYDLLIYVLLGLTISLIIKIVGVLFVFASLVIPPMIGLSLCRRTKWIFLSSISAGVLSIPAGLYFSYHWDLPSGPAIIGVYGVIFLAAALRRLFIKKLS